MDDRPSAPEWFLDDLGDFLWVRADQCNSADGAEAKAAELGHEFRRSCGVEYLALRDLDLSDEDDELIAWEYGTTRVWDYDETQTGQRFWLVCVDERTYEFVQRNEAEALAAKLRRPVAEDQRIETIDPVQAADAKPLPA